MVHGHPLTCCTARGRPLPDSGSYPLTSPPRYDWRVAAIHRTAVHCAWAPAYLLHPSPVPCCTQELQLDGRNLLDPMSLIDYGIQGGGDTTTRLLCVIGASD